MFSLFAGVLTLFTAKGLLFAMNPEVSLQVYYIYGRETTSLAIVVLLFVNGMDLDFTAFQHRSHLNQLVVRYQSASWERLRIFISKIMVLV